MVLTRVCSLWRSVALSSPRLWARLHIPFSDDYLDGVTDEYHSGDAEEWKLKATKVLQLRCNVAEEWLMRSGTCPLDISIHYLDSRRFRDLAALKDHGEGDLTIQLLRIIFQFKDRLQSLQLLMHENIYRAKFEVMIPEGGLRMLRTLKTGLYLHAAAESQTSSPITLLNSPNLETVAIYTDRWTSNFLPLSTLQRLVSLSVDAVLPIANAFPLLKNCGNLVHCQLVVMDGAHNPDSWLTGVANLPHLQSFQIFDEDEHATNTQFMLRFYSAIRAPHMKWLNYQFSGDPKDTIDSTFPILPLLESAKELRKLTLDLAALPDHFIRKALEAVGHSVTHLVFGPEPSGPSRKIWPWSPPRNFRPTVIGTCGLRLLVIPPPSDDPSVHPQDVLMPHLEIFESAVGSDISDETVLQFIINRMDSTSPTGIAKLKRVRLALSRTKQTDISEAVTRYQESMKLDSGEVHLDITYLPVDSRRRRVDRLSPSCGVSLQDDKTWHHLEIEQSTLPEG
ncbi:hypothetical protein GALMADRAFT_240426 [Galerina marginata CBS 339.88]|uniref:F-box domain-containing protein n=1 Tax=Galerina marginata (strain CBS 339.88) TaxID=685588 RepID=A0A067TQ42_GALM3|nr:hypothetical protein GALMADRAFT_240426 [Galerina marginata CBS 339.88]